jgi:hypothetical protein
VQAWLKRLQSEVFRHSISHLQQCFEKFDCAVDQVARCRAIADDLIGRFSERVRQGQEQPFSESDHYLMVKNSTEVSLFLDSMFLYMRIQADTYAELVTFFYPGRDQDRIPSDSFRAHRKWFIDSSRDRTHLEDGSGQGLCGGSIITRRVLRDLQTQPSVALSQSFSVRSSDVRR